MYFCELLSTFMWMHVVCGSLCCSWYYFDSPFSCWECGIESCSTRWKKELMSKVKFCQHYILDLRSLNNNWADGRICFRAANQWTALNQLQVQYNLQYWIFDRARILIGRYQRVDVFHWSAPNKCYSNRRGNVRACAWFTLSFTFSEKTTG